ncbi:shikimate kinase [Aquipuribacter sp. SD81]|uniref:shikimate kinase n=1 Tax=Aquipuribacter sp. SD81 TaxID=3127703 RepID=UPI00301864FC
MSGVQPGVDGPLVVLVGPPGAGKTTVAAALGRLLGADVRDTDADVEARAGRTVAEIFVDSGEPVFRDLEREAVADAVASHRGVLALGGGAPVDPTSRARLAGQRVVFLDVGLAAAARRIGMDAPRPLLLDSPRATWTRLMDARRPVYTEVADLVVTTTELDAEAVAAAVVAHYDDLRERAGWGPAPATTPGEQGT